MTVVQVSLSDDMQPLAHQHKIVCQFFKWSLKAWICKISYLCIQTRALWLLYSCWLTCRCRQARHAKILTKCLAPQEPEAWDSLCSCTWFGECVPYARFMHQSFQLVYCTVKILLTKQKCALGSCNKEEQSKQSTTFDRTYKFGSTLLVVWGLWPNHDIETNVQEVQRSDGSRQHGRHYSPDAWPRNKMFSFSRRIIFSLFRSPSCWRKKAISAGTWAAARAFLMSSVSASSSSIFPRSVPSWLGVVILMQMSICPPLQLKVWAKDLKCRLWQLRSWDTASLQAVNKWSRPDVWICLSRCHQHMTNSVRRSRILRHQTFVLVPSKCRTEQNRTDLPRTIS